MMSNLYIYVLVKVVEKSISNAPYETLQYKIFSKLMLEQLWVNLDENFLTNLNFFFFLLARSCSGYSTCGLYNSMLATAINRKVVSIKDSNTLFFIGKFCILFPSRKRILFYGRELQNHLNII